MDQGVIEVLGEDTEDLDHETPGQSMGYRTCAATIAGGSDTMQGPVLYVVETRVDTSERGVTNDRGDQQAPSGMYQKDQR